MIKFLKINKIHGYNDISIRIIKIWNSAVLKPWPVKFNFSIKCGLLPDIWEQSSVIPVYKKGENHCLKNHRQIYLLPICGKIL